MHSRLLPRTGYERLRTNEHETSDEEFTEQRNRNAKNRVGKTLIKILGLLCFLATCVVIIVVVIYVNRNSKPSETPSNTEPPIEKLYKEFKKAAVVTNAPPCATIGKQILERGGKAVDAMIGAMLCDGLTLPQSMGIGGGFFMVIYDRKHKNISTINARETAPAAATENMFHANPKSAQIGGLAVAIPGEIKGYWTAYNKFGGGIPWKDIFVPVISLCEQGIPIDEKLAGILMKNEEDIKKDAEFSTLFVNSTTGAILKEGMKYKNLKLASTLKIIAEQGGDAFYTGPLAAKLSSDIQKNGGIITEADLKTYEVDMSEPLIMPIFKNYTMYSLVPPSSGLVLGEILRLVNGIIPGDTEFINTQRITEAFKWAYGKRSHLGDHHFVNATPIIEQILNDLYIQRIRGSIKDNETWNDPRHYGGDFEEMNDHGTANLAVLAENGDAVVATSTINLRFGSRLISESTGIILNNEMDDFSSPNLTNYFGVEPSTANLIKPGKRPMSSMCPSIILDGQGNVKMLVGAAGGTKITTSVAITIIRTLLMNESIRSAMDNVLFHHQLTPMEWNYYPQISKDIIKKMEEIGHVAKIVAPTSFAAVTGIYRDGDSIFGSCDRKRPGQVDGL